MKLPKIEIEFHSTDMIWCLLTDFWFFSRKKSIKYGFQKLFSIEREPYPMWYFHTLIFDLYINPPRTKND